VAILTRSKAIEIGIHSAIEFFILTTLRVSVGLDQIKKKAANAAAAAEDVPTPNSSFPM
jgi:hypothetical protein